MANTTYTYPKLEAGTAVYPRYIIADTDASKPSSGLNEGDLCYAVDTDKLYKATGATTWTEIGAGGSGYSTIEEDGTPLTQRTTINFTGAGVTASDSGGETVVNIPGGAGADPVESSHVFGSNTTMSAAKSAYISRYMEISAGVAFEIGAGSDLEIG